MKSNQRQFEPGGVICVTHAEFSKMRELRELRPDRDVEACRAICELLGLQLKDMAYKQWDVKVVPEVTQRIIVAEPPKTNRSQDKKYAEYEYAEYEMCPSKLIWLKA